MVVTHIPQEGQGWLHQLARKIKADKRQPQDLAWLEDLLGFHSVKDMASYTIYQRSDGGGTMENSNRQ